MVVFGLGVGVLENLPYLRLRPETPKGFAMKSYVVSTLASELRFGQL